MLTVLLATRNRAAILGQILDAYCRVRPPNGGWKIVVVDNGSTDTTSEVIASFVGRLPLHSLVEPAPGKNVALNSGLPFVEGDLVVLTDDDAFPHPDCLVEFRAAADAHRDYSIFGGKIIPRWETSPPPWIRWLDASELGTIFAITDEALLDGPVPLNQVSTVHGPNMAVRTEIFRSGISFDPNIGPRGSDYPMGSEAELIARLSKRGHKAWHVKTAVVEHLIRKAQLSQDWVLQRAIRCGRGRQRMASNVKIWRGIPLHLLRDMPKEALAILRAVLSGRQDELLRARWRFNILRGKAIEANKLARGS